MSMIEKMSVMGIRSFGPDDGNQQVIQFQHPLTLLVGPNGAGKTTIIECLKYATTGDHPLNTKGGAFVHDPKLAKETEVRAKVRLKCRTIRGDHILIERGMIAVQKQKNVQFKTLDGVITKFRNEEKVSITSKCAELNREMVSALGVSKAVLDNVIFCHQEESNWPLSEGKSVKQRFDDIFAATRYIKALDEIRKIQKSQKGQLREENVALGFLKTNSDRATDTKNNLETARRKLEAAKQSGENITTQLTPIEDELRELSRKRADVIKLDGQLGALKSRKEQMIEDKAKLRTRINNIFQGTDEQLNELQRDQKNILEMKRQRQNDCEAQIEPMKENIQILNKRKISLSVEQGKLQREVTNAEEKRKSRNDLARKYGEELGARVADLEDHEITTTDIEQFQSSFKTYITNETKKQRSEKLQLVNGVKEAEQEYKDGWQAKVEVEQGVKHKKKSLAEVKDKLVKTNRELNRIQTASDSDQLFTLQEQLEGKQSELKKLEKSFDLNKTRNQLKEMNTKKSYLQEEFDSLENEISDMQKSSTTRTKIDVLRKDKAAKEESLSRLKKKNLDSLSTIGLATRSSFPDKKKLAQWIREKENEMRKVQTQLDTAKSQATKLSTEHGIILKQLKDKEARHNQLDETIFELCGSQDLDNNITVLEKEIKEMQGSKGLTDGIQHMYRKFIRKLRTEDEEMKKETPCPLCQRLFDEPSEVDELISMLEVRLNQAPRKLQKQARDLEEKQTRHKLLQDNKPIKMELDKLDSTELPELRRLSKELSSLISKVEKSRERLDENCVQLREEENTAKSCFPDLAQIDALSIEVRQLDQEVQYLESQLPSSSSSQSMEDLGQEKRKVSEQLKKASHQIEVTRRDMESKSDQIHVLKNEVNQIQEEKLKLTSDLQKCEQLQDVQKGLNSDLKRIKNEIEDSEKSWRTLEDDVSVLEAKKKELANESEEKINEMNRRRQLLESKLRELEAMNRDIEKFEESGIEDKLEKNERMSRDIDTKIAAASKKVEQLQENVAKIEKDLATVADRQRDLEDNVALRERDRDIEEVTKEILDMEGKLNGMNVDRLEEESRRLNQEHQRLNKDRERGREREVHLRENVATLRRELNKDDFKYADDRYKESLIKCTTLDLASDDLGKYYKALDRAVMRFHQIKMDEINKIIKNLWQETYRGKDIEYIQICSDEDTGASNRRTFNYRVVMYFGGVGMDMRGRCSAGQKVLASLVIRLALAETFCINCGILALDEPTTNLDRDNIESLAKALVSIIESRSSQRNFQLVVITHDEDFVDLLGRSSYVDHFFRIEKDDRSRSRIIKCPIRDLNS
ncbi:unnamed protein product [Clavelina lepadiformis]|uniref:Zinc-hook domain-containing protein n=1 Tax=Clavelina lepadiformis TaxID=159417 RepID=A0ABP0G4U8_CLALP